MPKLLSLIRRIFRALGPLLVICIFLGADWLLYRQIS